MRDIVVQKYKGERALQRGLNDMAKKGYVVDQQASRKALYSLATGVFTRKQIHTVTFRKQASATPAVPAARPAPRPPSQAPAPVPPAAGAPSSLIDQLERLGKLRDSAVLTTEEFEAQKAILLGGPSAAAPAPVQVTGTWDVVFVGLAPGNSKITAVASVSDLAGVDLASAKRIVDNAAGETLIRSGVGHADADSLKNILESAGLEVEVRPMIGPSAP